MDLSTRVAKLKTFDKSKMKPPSTNTSVSTASRVLRGSENSGFRQISTHGRLGRSRTRRLASAHDKASQLFTADMTSYMFLKSSKVIAPRSGLPLCRHCRSGPGKIFSTQDFTRVFRFTYGNIAASTPRGIRYCHSKS